MGLSLSSNGRSKKRTTKNEDKEPNPLSVQPPKRNVVSFNPHPSEERKLLKNNRTNSSFVRTADGKAALAPSPGGIMKSSFAIKAAPNQNTMPIFDSLPMVESDEEDDSQTPDSSAQITDRASRMNNSREIGETAPSSTGAGESPLKVAPSQPSLNRSSAPDKKTPDAPLTGRRQRVCVVDGNATANNALGETQQQQQISQQPPKAQDRAEDKNPSSIRDLNLSIRSQESLTSEPEKQQHLSSAAGQKAATTNAATSDEWADDAMGISKFNAAPFTSFARNRRRKRKTINLSAKATESSLPNDLHTAVHSDASRSRLLAGGRLSLVFDC